jgi:hypothetical protein
MLSTSIARLPVLRGIKCQACCFRHTTTYLRKGSLWRTTVSMRKGTLYLLWMNRSNSHCWVGWQLSFVSGKLMTSLLHVNCTHLHQRTEIRRFVKRYEDSRPEDFSKRIATLLELDSQISRALELLHPDARASNMTAFRSAKGNDAYRLFWVHGIYRICACTLHSSLVPLYSNNPPHPQVGKNLVRLSAEEVVKHAASTLDMATAFLSTNPDVARLSGTTGYVLFVAVTLHFKSLVAQRKLRNPGVLSRFKAALYILDRLKIYWSTIGTLVRLFAINTCTYDYLQSLVVSIRNTFR